MERWFGPKWLMEGMAYSLSDDAEAIQSGLAYSLPSVADLALLWRVVVSLASEGATDSLGSPRLLN